MGMGMNVNLIIRHGHTLGHGHGHTLGHGHGHTLGMSSGCETCRLNASRGPRRRCQSYYYYHCY